MLDRGAAPTDAEAFWTDGACVVRGALTPAGLAAVEMAIATLDGGDELADLSALAGASEQARFRAGVDHWRTSAVFREIATEGALPAAAARILGTERLWLYEDSVLVKEAGADVATRWHTDDGYFHVEGEQLATLWAPLEGATSASGALHFLAGSHRSGTSYRPTLFVVDDPIPGTEGEAPPQLAFDDPAVRTWDLQPGDLTIHHARTLHAAHGNTTDRPRRALSIRYCGDDAVVRVKPGAPGKPGFDEVAPGTPVAEAAAALGLPEAVLR